MARPFTVLSLHAGTILLVVVFFGVNFYHACQGYVGISATDCRRRQTYKEIPGRVFAASNRNRDEDDNHHEDDNIFHTRATTDKSRRNVMGTVLAAAASTPSLFISIQQLSKNPALAVDETAVFVEKKKKKNSSIESAPRTTATIRGIDCLKDLPDYDPNITVRLFLCRHGETELNRLHQIQGARMNPPINDTGMRQATLLGRALARATRPPTLVFHSPLLRAQQTAEIVQRQIQHHHHSQSTSSSLLLQPLDTLAELDFGPVAEGKPIESVRAEMAATYLAWEAGHLEARMVRGGESAREMLDRIERALQVLVAEASNTKTGCIAAIAHSTYLRMMLGSIANLSFVAASRLQQSNCCINVLDFPRSNGAPTTTASNLMVTRENLKAFRALFLSSNFLVVPESSRYSRGRVLRVNEKRHLELLENTIT